MLRIGICDDELHARESLRLLLEPLLYEDGEQISYEFSNGKSAISWLKKHPGELDLLFLDIEMPSLDGMAAARLLREFDNQLLLVFVTGYGDYVFDGYQVDALDYLIKPVKKDKLALVLQKVRHLLEVRTPDTFTFRGTDGTYRLLKKDILYFYSDKRLVYVVTEGSELSFYEKLDTLESSLGASFVRIHQRYLVNGNRVDYIGASSIRIGERELPLSRSQKLAATSMLAKLMLGGFSHDC